MRGSTLVSGPTLNTFKAKSLNIGILHAGGPAPGGNKVFYAASLRAKDHGVPLIAFTSGLHYLLKGASEIVMTTIEAEQIRYLRDQNALVFGTARDNPGKEIETLADLSDTNKNDKLTKLLDIFEALRIGSLITIGGDDTMRTANLIQRHRENLILAGRQFESFMGVVHVPKTIDKDYYGIPCTFGFMTAAQDAGEIIKKFRDDAKAAATDTQPTYHVVEVMGRAAGWLTGAAAIYGQATLALVPEDYEKGEITIEELAVLCADMILKRRDQGKHFGVFALSEGVATKLSQEELDSLPKDEQGHPSLDSAEIGIKLSKAIKAELLTRSGLKGKIQPQKAGYVVRQGAPNIYDVLLCERLGVSAIDAILNGEFGNMVSADGFFHPTLVPFKDLIDANTMRAKNWVMNPEEGLYRLMRAMEQPF